MSKELKIKDVQKYLGIPWEFAAEGPHTYDCWGLVKKCLMDCGIAPAINVDYKRLSGRKDAFESGINSELFYKLETPQSNCLVLGFRGIYPIHIGFVIGKYALHSIGSNGEGGSAQLTMLEVLKKQFSKVEYYAWH